MSIISCRAAPGSSAFLALAYAVDLIDTAVKGKQYFLSYGVEYPLRNAVYILLCIIAALTANRRFHAAFLIAGLTYQVVWIFRAFDLLD